MSRKKVQPISDATRRRLPGYLSFAKLQLALGQRYVTSTTIAQSVGEEQSVVAKDLSCVKVRGRTKVGYLTKEFVEVLEEFLGFTENHKAILVGVGNLGHALLTDKGLQQYGLEIAAGFDIKPELIGSYVEDIPIHHIEDLREVKEQHGASIAILTVPIKQAQEVTDQLAEVGFEAVWNFTPIRLRVPKDMVVQDTSMYAHLAMIFTRIREQAQQRALIARVKKA